MRPLPSIPPMRRYRVQIRDDLSLTVDAPDQVSATMTALLWAVENGEDLFIDRMSESVTEIEPGPGPRGPASIAPDAPDAPAPGPGESDVIGPGHPVGRIVLGAGLGLPGFPEIPGLWKRLPGTVVDRDRAFLIRAIDTVCERAWR